MDDENTSTLDHVLIYAAIMLLPSAVYRFLGVLDEGAALLYVYNKVKDKITPDINAKVEDTLNAWFGPEYVWIEG